MAESNVGQYLTEHPRLIGALFTLGGLLVSAGAVLADGGGGCTNCGGP